MGNGLTRRTALRGALAGGAACLMAPRGYAAGPGQVVVCTWGGSYTDAQRRALFDPFSKATGIKVITTGTPNLAKLKVMQETGSVQWDLIDAEGQMMFKAAQEKMLVPIDYDLIYKITPRGDFVAGSAQPDGFASVAFGWVLAWSTKTFPKQPPQNWSDFWDTSRFPGRRAMYAEPKPLLEIALMADGVPKDRIYPIDVDRAYAKLDKIKPHINIWVSDTAQYDVLMQNGEVDLMLSSLGRATLAHQHGVPFDFTFNQGLWEQSYWIIPKGAPNAKNAMKLLAFMLQPQPQAAFADAFAIGVPNSKAYALMKPNVAATLPTAPQNLSKELRVDAKWWTDNLDAMNRRWLDWYTRR